MPTAAAGMLSVFGQLSGTGLRIEGLPFHLEQARSTRVMDVNSRLASAKRLQHKLVGIRSCIGLALEKTPSGNLRLSSTGRMSVATLIDLIQTANE